MIALDYASKFPASLKGLVLVDSGGTSLASYSKAFSDNRTTRMSADDHAAQQYWSQPDVVAKDPMRAAIELYRAILPSMFYDRSKAHQAIAILRVGKEHLNPEASKYLLPAYEQQASASIPCPNPWRLQTKSCSRAAASCCLIAAATFPG